MKQSNVARRGAIALAGESLAGKSPHVFSAKGAPIHLEPGAAPQDWQYPKTTSAETAIHSGLSSIHTRLTRAFSACLHGDWRFWGGCSRLSLKSAFGAKHTTNARASFLTL